MDKISTPQSEDRRGTDAARARSAEDRWTTLKAMRRAQGLCQRCAEKLSRCHRCAEQVQLHALQEVMELFMMEDTTETSEIEDTSPTDQLFLSISLAATTGKSS